MRFRITFISTGSTWRWRWFSDEDDEWDPHDTGALAMLAKSPDVMPQNNSTRKMAESYLSVCSHLWAI